MISRKRLLAGPNFPKEMGTIEGVVATVSIDKFVRGHPRPLADNVALLYYVLHAAARLLLTAGPPCSNRSMSPGRRAHSSKPAAAACGGRIEC